VSEQRLIPLCVTLDGRQVSSETVCDWAGAYVLVIATTLPDPGLALEVYSTFVGHPEVDTYVTHLRLGPVGHEPLTITAEHDHEQLNPKTKPRECAYEHMEILVEALNSLAFEVGIVMPEDAFGELERVER
jgi:hypothetical protein